MRERLVRAASHSAREGDAPEAETLEPPSPAPMKHTRVAEAGALEGARSPAKRTRTEAQAEGHSPAQALAYARWLLHPARGWQPVARRAETAETPDLGALASAFAYLAEGSSGPRSLPPDLAQRLTENFGLDATLIRIHTDDRAASAAALLRARAFTLGADIYFAAGAYDPHGESGIELIAHELAHVAQYLRGQALGAGEAVSRPSDAHEREADELAQRFLAAQRRPPSALRAAGNAVGKSPAGHEDAAAEAASADLWGAPVRRKAAPLPAAAPLTGSLAQVARKPASGGASGRGASKSAVAALPVVVDLLGKADFEPTPELATHIEKAGAAGADVRVRLGSMSLVSLLRVKKVGRRYVTVEDRPQVVPISHSLFVPAPGLSPVLRVRIGAGGSGSAITGYLASAVAPESKSGLARSIGDNPSSIGLRGFELPSTALENELSGGTLTFGTKRPMRFELGGWVHGDLSFGLSNRNVTFDATANLHARGLRDAELRLSRDGKGNVVGSARLAVDLGDKFTGTATATYRDGDVAISGELSYASEKFRGKLGIMVADVAAAEQMVRAQLDPLGVQPVAGVGGAGGAKPAPVKGKKGERGIAGWGALDFAFTDWLVGKAQVVYGPSGHLTVVGKIAPPQRLDLMKTPKGIKKPIVPETRIEASYGLPYIADVHVGIGVSLSANAELGPIYMTDLGIEGVYSTDPAVMNAFSITGALRAQAQAGLSLDVKGYAGLRILKHSVNFGAAIKGDAGIKAYAEARPTLGYREVASPTAGKQGEYYLKGHLEMTAQPVLALGGRLFIELDSPWWSPAPDKTWEWPLGKLEYPLPTQLGVGADIDYVVGSGQWPEVKLTQPSFNPGKFVDTLMDDKLPSRGGRAGTQQKQGQWQGVAPTKPTAAPPIVAKKPVVEPKADTSAGTGKPKKGKQTPEEKKNVPKSQDAAARWNTGMEALGELRKRSEKDPETQAEIQQHLSELKARHGFTKLSADRAGDLWLVDAAMNPEKKDIPIKADPKEKPEEKGKDGKKEDAQRVVFEPITVRAEMPGGYERVRAQPSTKQGKGHAELWIAGQKGLKRIDDILAGPISEAKNQAGRLATLQTLEHLVSIEEQSDKVGCIDGKIARDDVARAQQLAERAASEVSALGRKLRTNSLEGAGHKRPMTNRRTVTFNKPDPAKWKKEYVGKFTAEMVRQLRQQEEGLGKLTIDAWVVNRELFSPSEHLNELHETARQEVLRVLKERCVEGLPRARARLQKLQARKQKVEAALQALQASAGATSEAMKAALKQAVDAAKDVTSVSAEIQGYLDASEQVAAADAGSAVDPKKMAGAGGREDGQAAWANKHRKAKAALVKLLEKDDPLVADWQDIVKKVGDLAVLHDPDQIAGGHGDIPALPVIKEPKTPSDSDGHEAWREYLAKVKSHLGVLDINSSLGSQWKTRIEKLHADVIKDPDNPQEAYGIRTLNVKLIPE